MFTVSFFWFFDAFIVVLLLLLGITSLLNGGINKKTNRLFALFALLMAIWIPANHVSNSELFPLNVVYIANYLVFPSSFAALIVLMIFLDKLAGDTRLHRLIRAAMPLLLIVCFASATPLLVAGIERQGHVFAVLFGPMIWVYGAAMITMFGAITYTIMRGLVHLKGASRKQLKVISASIAVSVPLTALLVFILPSITGIFAFTEFGISPLIILVAGLYYSVIKHQLFDIRLAAVRTVAYILSLLVLAVGYYFLAYLVSVTLFQGDTVSGLSLSPVNILLAMALAFVFQPIRQFFDRITDKIFLRDRYRVYDFYERLSEVLTSTKDLRNLLQRAATEIGTTLKSEQVFFHVKYGEQGRMVAGMKGHIRIPQKDIHDLDGYIQEQGDRVIVTDMLEDARHIRKLLRSHKITVLLPLMHRKEVTGYLALGEQRGNGYTPRDVRTLQTVSSELVIAIQNALAVQEVKELNAHLQQRINTATSELRRTNSRLRRLDATKDEFLSMASHQLRTPLTSIKGYLSMVIDGDMGKVTPAQKKVLEEAFTSSERMVHLIHDFLNVSRLQTGKFMLELTQTNLPKLIHEEVTSLQRVAKSRNMTISYEDSTGGASLLLDDTKIRQVVMNYIDNALYYSKPETTVRVELTKDTKEVFLKVHDTGIGVPLNEQSRLFSKFFRATNARKQRPDGTGVGLYLAKKVITAHGGDVLFSSKQDRGSMFGFRLPLGQSQAALESDSSEKLEK